MANPILDKPGDDILDGTGGYDVIDFSKGGSDTVNALAGDDDLSAGGALDAFDKVDGGAGYDQLSLAGSYAGLVLGAATVTNVEELDLLGNFNYTITTHDGTVAAGATLVIDDRGMSPGKSVVFNGAAETNGRFNFISGSNSDSFTGGAKDDSFSFGDGGNDIGHGGAGGDAFSMWGGFNALDQLDGGAGGDIVYLSGNYASLVTFNAKTFTSIDSVSLNGDNDYNLKTHDGNVAAGESMWIDGRTIGGHLLFDGSAETDGTFAVYDSANNDTVKGGGQADEFRSYGGSDTLVGNGGDDIFIMSENLDATDSMQGGAGFDYVHLNGDYSAGVTFGAQSLIGIDRIDLQGGDSYKFKTADGNVAAGQSLIVSSGTEAGETFKFDGSLETDGTFSLLAGGGNDYLSGGAKDDYFAMYDGGADVVHGGAGGDRADFGATFGAGDLFDGGMGDDFVYFSGAYAGNLTLGSAQLADIEGITFGPDFNYHVIANDSLVGAGKSLAVDDFYNLAGKGLLFDGSAETNGKFVFSGGDGADTFIGGAGADKLAGYEGDDVLTGGAGADAFDGGADSDTASYSTAQAGVTASLINPLANTGDAAGDTYVSIENLTGSNFKDSLYGDAGGNAIKGGAGDDTMYGLGGNDTYYADNAADSIVESAGQGTADWVATSVSYILAAGVQVEKLSTTSSGAITAIDLTGNEFVQAIIGNAGDNKLDGKAGADTMTGLGGNDTFYIDNAGDKVVEGAGQGTSDWAATSVSYTLAAAVQVEKLSTTISGGVAAIDLTGNEFAQFITGNAGDNKLNGMGGADTMSGLGGNDTYYVDNAGDKVVEGAGQGTSDWVATSVNYTLAAAVQVEKLSTTISGGVAAINLTGNEFAQFITGNAGDNFVNGKAGNDTLTGLGGADSFVFDTGLNAATNVDTITDYNAAADTIRLDNAIFTQIVGTGTLTAGQFVSNATGLAGDANDRIIYEADTGKVFYDTNGSAAGGSFHFATLDAGLALTNADFIIF